jgi:hypothetical protein
MIGLPVESGTVTTFASPTGTAILVSLIEFILAPKLLPLIIQTTFKDLNTQYHHCQSVVHIQEVDYFVLPRLGV